MNDPLGLFEDENNDPLGLFESEPKKASFGTAMKTQFAGIGNVADTALSTLAGSAAGLFGDDQAAIDIEEQRKARALQRNQWANPDNEEISGLNKLGSVVATLPMQIVNAGLSPADTADRLKAAGETNATAIKGAGVDALGNVAGMILPGFKQGSAVVRGMTGFGANAAQDVATKKAIQAMAETEEGKRQFQPTMEDAAIAGVIGGATGIAAGKGKMKKPSAVSDSTAKILEELKAPKPEASVLGKETPADYHATEGLDGQRSLFDIPEEGRMPNPYEAVTGDWRIDENGMPIKVDLSMDVANAENPLQRNLWGDELPQKHEQENARNLPEAIDSMDWAHKRGALKKTQLGRGLDAPGELEAAKMAAEPTVFNTRTHKQGGAINPDVFVEGFEKLKKLANGVVLTAKGTGDNLNITATRDGKYVGAAVYDKTNKYDAPAQSDMYAKALGSKERGTATQLYKFANELGNDIVPSKKLTEGGAAVWNKLEREGIAVDKKIPFNFKKQGGGINLNWGKKKELSALKDNPTFADKLKDVGNSMINSPAEAVKLASSATDVNQNMAQKLVSQLTKGGIYLKTKVDHPVVHYTVDRFLQADSISRAKIMDRVHNEYLNALRDLPKQEMVDAFTLLNAADLNKSALTPDMLARLPEKTAKFLTEHQKLMGDALVEINTAREASGKKPISAREAYSAFNMTGDYRKVAYKMVDGRQEVVGVIGSNTKGLGKRGLESLESQMKAADPSLEFGPLIDKSRTRTSSKGTPNEAFTDILKTIGEDNPHFKEFLDTLAEVAKNDPTTYMGMDQHTLQKKGVWGMEGRKPWLSAEENAKAFFENQVKYVEGAFQWGELSKAAKEVNEVLRNDAVAGKQNNAVKLSEDYMYNALGMNPSDVGNGVNAVFNSLFRPFGIGPSVPKAGIEMARSVANTWMLSLSPMFLALNAVQPLAAAPGMIAYLRGKGMDSFGIGGNLKAIKTVWRAEHNKGAMTPIETGALKYAKENHVYATDMVEHSNQTARDGRYYWTKVTQAPAALVETGTRQNVYLTLVHALHDGGLSVKDGLYEQAHRFTDMAMNNYGQMEKPPIYNALGPVGSMAYNLRSFAHNEISRWSLYAREAIDTGNAAPLLAQMATTIAMAGVMGLPFFSQWEELYAFITKHLGNPRSLALDVMDASEALGEHIDPKAMYAMSHGLWSILGADTSTRLGLGDVIPGTAADAAFAGGGKLASMIGSVVDLAKQRNEETLEAAAYNLAPPFMQGPLDLEFYTKGDIAYSKDPNSLKPLARRNEVDKMMRKIGITGINESVQKQKNWQNKQLDMTYLEYQKKALNTIKQDIKRDRAFEQSTMDKYFVDGQGDPASFVQQLNSMAVELHLAPDELAVLKDSASKSITKARSLQRRVN